KRRRSGNVGFAGVSLIAAVSGLFILNSAFNPMRASYFERASEETNPQHLQELADPEAWKIIENTLAANKAEFGGFLTPSWPQSNFTNAAFNYYGQLHLFHEGTIKLEPGYCVFWVSTPEAKRVFA